MKKSTGILTADLSAPATNQIRYDATETTERSLADVLADVVHVERVPVDAHFFDDLGADSMVMARFCARVRKREDLPSVSMKDVYRHPTISSLATALVAPRPCLSGATLTTDPRRGAGRDRAHRPACRSTRTSSTTSAPTRWSWPTSAPGCGSGTTCRRCRSRTSTSTHDQGPGGGARRHRARPDVDAARRSRVELVAAGAGRARPAACGTSLCGALQLLVFLGYSYLAAVIVVPGLRVDLGRLTA